MTLDIARSFGTARRSLACAAIFLVSGFASPSLLAQSEPNTLEQLRSAIERHDYSNERRARYAARACDEFNDGESCFKRATLARVYFPDLGDETLQSKYFIKACGRGIGAGCGWAGDMEYLGRGTKQDKILAYNLYTTGCSNGDEDSCKNKSAISSEVRSLLAAKGYPTASSPPQNATSGSGSIPPANASFSEQSAALREVAQVTSVGTATCNKLIGRLRVDQGQNMGELGQRWWRLLEASYRSGNNACNEVPVVISRQIEAPIANTTPPISPRSSNYTSCDSTCQRQKTIRDNTPLSCYVKDGRRICNK